MYLLHTIPVFPLLCNFGGEVIFIFMLVCCMRIADNIDLIKYYLASWCAHYAASCVRMVIFTFGFHRPQPYRNDSLHAVLLYARA